MHHVIAHFIQRFTHSMSPSYVNMAATDVEATMTTSDVHRTDGLGLNAASFRKDRWDVDRFG